MRIAFDYQTFMLQSYGGISRYFARLAQGLYDIEQGVKVFAPLHRNAYLLALPEEIRNGMYIHRYPKPMRLFSAYNKFRSRYEIARWKPDVVHETYYSMISSAPPSCPVVVTIYDMIHELFPDDFSAGDNTATIKRAAVGRADHVICISENTKKDLIHFYGTPANKLSVVHLGFDQFKKNSVEQMTMELAGRPFLLYVGQRDGYKNFNGLLTAVASSKRLLSDFNIVAFGGPAFSLIEQNLMSSLGFSENQILHKSGNDDLLGMLYSAARAFVYPSLYEGFGIPPLEAMAHQCPVIASNTSSMPEVIGSAGEYFEPADEEDIRRAIEAVVYSDSRVECLRKLGATRLTNYSWDKCTGETLNIYHSLTGGR